MKVQLKAPIESSGWGRAAEELLKALRLVPKWEPALIPLNKDFDVDTEVAIHFFLPNNLSWQSGRKNICYFFYETDTIKYTVWPENLQLMDEIWVASSWFKQVLINDGVKVPIKVVPIPVNIEKFYKKYPSVIDKQNEFLFYWIGDLNPRKNLPALIRAFHLEFEPHESVGLVIKASKSQVFKSLYQYSIKDICDKIKTGLKLYTDNDLYKSEIILSDNEITDEQMLAIHQDCDCFVSTSRSEGFNLPCLDALGFGNTPIIPNWSGHTDLVNKKNGWLCDYEMVPVHGMNDIMFDLYCGKENWCEVSTANLMKNMRECYENREKRCKLSNRGKKDALKFSYHEVANHIYEQQKETQIHSGDNNS